MKKTKIGLGQLLVEGGEPERNLDRAIELITKEKKIIVKLFYYQNVLILVGHTLLV